MIAALTPRNTCESFVLGLCDVQHSQTGYEQKSDGHWQFKQQIIG